MGNIVAALDHTENKLCKNMRIYNTALKLAGFIQIMLRKNVLNSGNCQNILELWRRSEVIGYYKKIPPLYLGKN